MMTQSFLRTNRVEKDGDGMEMDEEWWGSSILSGVCLSSSSSWC